MDYKNNISSIPQYSLMEILGIWASVALTVGCFTIWQAWRDKKSASM